MSSGLKLVDLDDNEHIITQVYAKVRACVSSLVKSLSRQVAGIFLRQ